ncbi:MAG: ankyrin repeat domain-containing protein [Planctomycetota bacterium]
MSDDKLRALLKALTGDRFEEAGAVLAAGFDVDTPGPRDVTALYAVLDAAFTPERLAWLLARGADAGRPAGPHGEAAVHVAARRRRVDAVHALAAHGVDLDARNRGRKSAYQHAVRRGFDDVAEALAGHGCDRALDAGDRFAVHMNAGELDAARALAAEGAIVDPANPEETRLLPDLAGRFDVVEAVELLLDLGFPVDARGLDGGTSLHVAGWFAQPEVIDLLLPRGAALELLCEEHRFTPLGWVTHGSRYSGGAAARNAEYGRCAQALLDAGASLVHPDRPDDLSGAWLLRDAQGEVKRRIEERLS